MQWFKAPVSMMDHPSGNEILGMWVRVCAWMASHECSDDRMPEVRPRSWPLTPDEHSILIASELVHDGRLLHAPGPEISRVQGMREAGKKGGRPRKQPAKPKGKTQGKTQGFNPTENPEKIREDKRREEQTRVDDEARTPETDAPTEGEASASAEALFGVEDTPDTSPVHAPLPDFMHWRQQHPRIQVSRMGDDGDKGDWEALWASCHREQEQARISQPEGGWPGCADVFTLVYTRCTAALADAGHRVFFDKFNAIYQELNNAG
jgi:hypothetical protein